MQSNFQQNLEHSTRSRQYKQPRAQALQQPLQQSQNYLRQPPSQYGAVQQQGQRQGPYNEQMFHQQQQQSYLAKLEQARELDRTSMGGGARGLSVNDDRQQPKSYFDSSAKPTLQLMGGANSMSPRSQRQQQMQQQQQIVMQHQQQAQPQQFQMNGAVAEQPLAPLRRQKHRRNNKRNARLDETSLALPQIRPSAQLAPVSVKGSNARTGTPEQVIREVGGLQIVTEDHETVGVTSIRGLKPNNPYWSNQDNFFVCERFDQHDVYLYCVLDGHGEVGHLVSKRCREFFPQYIRAASLDMKRAFNMMQSDLCSCDFDSRCSGATCVIVCYMEGRLSVSNCGDSRAILGRRTSNGGYIAIPLSNDHKPDKPEERKRILNCGGHVGCRQVLVSQGPRGPVTMPVGPCRVWYQHKGDTLGLAMSRSLGDSIVHKCGVSAEPEILDHIVEPDDDFVIIATDGVWDVIDNNQAVQIVQNFAAKSQNPNWSTLEASNWICKVARGRWEKLSPMVDDITCLVIKLRQSVA